MSKHTPGPWRYRKSSREIGVIDKSDTQSNGMMLVVCMVDEWDFNDAFDANARLIAAAPDQNEALELTQILLERLGLDSSDEYQRNASALAKARGE